MIPIIDLFAGPGGLGEGFSSLLDERGRRIFKISLSIEKDVYAHQTLKLRSFFRQFPVNEVPDDYYTFVKGDITLKELYDRHPAEAAAADKEAWCGTLGKPGINDKNGLSNNEIDERIQEALAGRRNWLLIGGPPCQAYSIVGRARRQETKLNEDKDVRVGLYKEYLRIIAVHRPAVFVMENVTGLLSAQTERESIFQKILKDISNPVTTCIWEGEVLPDYEPVTYKIYSLTKMQGHDLWGTPLPFDPQDFIIKAEEYGIPQKRHRVILLGIREDIDATVNVLEKQAEVSLSTVIGPLPRIRSGVSRSFSHSGIVFDKSGRPQKKRYYNKLADSFEEWRRWIEEYNREINECLGLQEQIREDQLPASLGSDYIETGNVVVNHGRLGNWFFDPRLGGVLHHISRKHMAQDLKRYLFAARYAQIYGTFPRLEDYKKTGDDLLPDHENAESGKFTDRFRVQLPDIPATTVTSHIAKDGHYFIHYDPTQVRSLTVREAARIQTFPDNYYFCGGRTDQFHQVGNAVPPYLAYQIAQVVKEILPD